MSKLLLGPLLGVESDDAYTVCFLTEASSASASVELDGTPHPAVLASTLPSGKKFWRTELTIPPLAADQLKTYVVKIDAAIASDRNNRKSWRFNVPKSGAVPVMAYASCNGFSSADLVTKTEDPYRLWGKLKSQHDQKPFSLMIMGGDQLYADEIWGKVPELQKWAAKSREDKIKQGASQLMKRQIEKFYETLYIERWKLEVMSGLFASIPSVMMWDDHDIFDGWGSYPEDLQQCDVYQAIFEIASRYFELFQIRSKRNISLLAPRNNHFAFSVLFRGQHILGLDNRAERTLGQVMSSDQWNSVIAKLEKITSGNLIVMSAVPVVYRDFSATEAVFDATPWEEELTDDLKDHWRSKEHEGERARLIMNLLKNGRDNRPDGRTIILSGDVHVGCLGVINDSSGDKPVKIHQVVSSGIVHPAPGAFAWFGILAATNDRTEYLNEEKTIEIDMLKPYGSDTYIRTRNFATIEEGTDGKMWINWVCDNDNRPNYPLA